MNRNLVDPIANAVLYEGYVLYPYRPATKNRQRWTFGGLLPRSYCESRDTGDAWFQQTECLVSGTSRSRVEVVVRFLHLTARQVGVLDPPLSVWPEGSEPRFQTVDSLQVGPRQYQTWQEAEEREVESDLVALGDLCRVSLRRRFVCQGNRRSEGLQTPSGGFTGVLIRDQCTINGDIELAAAEVEPGLFRLTLRTQNQTAMPADGMRDRESALVRSLVSTHAILGLEEGEFVSLMDPPDRWRDAAAACRNLGNWPVLVGEEGQKNLMLASPIILYDYPRVAPESSGDYFDGTEIDEMLTLRIMTLTDAEKEAMSHVDERAGALLVRTETMAREQLLGLHGKVRDFQSAQLGGHA